MITKRNEVCKEYGMDIGIKTKTVVISKTRRILFNTLTL